MLQAESKDEWWGEAENLAAVLVSNAIRARDCHGIDPAMQPVLSILALLQLGSAVPLGLRLLETQEAAKSYYFSCDNATETFEP